MASKRYASLKTYLGNELANGRDLYQSDLDGAASQATRWLVHGNKTPNSLPTPPVVNSFIADKGTAKKPRKRQEKQPKVEEPVQHSDETCDFCKRKGHSQAKCFKYAAASKAAVEEAAAKKEKHSKRALGPVAGAMLATTHDDCSDETPFHKLTYHVTSLIVGGSMKLSPYDIVLDTGTNGSIVRNKNLLHELEAKSPLTFNGIAGALTTTKAGALRDLGKAYYHHFSPANILSFSQLREEGHTIHFERRDKTDMFIVSTPSFEYQFKDRGAGLYICDFTPVKTNLISTVQDNA